MEVVGAVASFIAIGQALSTARHVAHIARAIPGVEDEMKWLRNEVEALKLIKEELVRAGVIANDSKCETLFLAKAMLQLTESTKSLEEIRIRCIRSPSADNKGKVKKRAWFWLQAELSDCRGKAREARENLQLALQTINAQSITKLVLRIESLSMQIVSNVQQLESSAGTGDAPESPPSKDEKSSCRDEDLESLRDDKPLQVVAVRQSQQALPNPQASAPTDLITPQASSIVNQVSGDTDPNGVTALEIWEDQILNGNYHDSWFYEAHDTIANTPSLPEEKMQVLTRILSAGKWTVNASQTPLHDALCRGDFDAAFQAAEDFSWAINQRNYEGNTPLHVAATQGHLNSVKHLVHLGCDINEANWTGCTALMLASEGGHVLTVQYLIDAGSRLNVTNRRGDTAMMVASMAGSNNLPTILQALIRAGASTINTGLRNGDGETPWDYLAFPIHAQDWKRAGTLTLTPKRQEAFVSLFKSIRDRNLTVDIERLDWLLQYLRDRDQRGAIAALSPLIKQKEDWKRWEILGTYKAIGLQIREEMWEAAVESVEEVIDCLRARMATSPCDSESYYDPSTHTIYRARELV
ncbi:pfs domain-containing protein [Colletotrichum limetticola]|uniref:Pfs domain-containing protein n=2 Tax=Colletotrichum acutatum species complex TaxID=2707335 RepID=A0ABQ9Q6G6_9PEZI|nr:pfs domain-containing protein [Colletotrichum limetticola]